MFVVNDDLSIYATRGDIVCLNVSAMDDSTGTQYEFQAGDIVRMKIFGKKDAESIYLSKDFPVVAKTHAVGIMLTEEDTKIGDVISKPMDYWYEIELNPYTNPQTIVGYDEDGAKVFKLFPEGKDMVDEPTVPEDIPVVDKDLSLISSRPVENRAIARAVTLLKNDLETVDKRLTGKIKENKTANKELKEQIAVERARVDNLIALEKASLSQNLEYLETVGESMKAKVDGHIDSDGVFAKVTVNLREANLFYGGTELELFVIPEKCCPSATGLIYTEDGLEYYIRHDGTKYYMVIRGQSGVTSAPSSAGTVTFTYGLYNYEVKDIRVGADGVIYETAGAAVREQIKQFGDCFDIKMGANVYNPARCVSGYVMQHGGVLAENALYTLTDHIFVPYGYAVIATCKQDDGSRATTIADGTSNIVKSICVFEQDKATIIEEQGSSSQVGWFPNATTESDKYVRITFKHEVTPELMIEVLPIVNGITDGLPSVYQTILTAVGINEYEPYVETKTLRSECVTPTWYKGKKVAVLGDSITELNTWQPYVSDYLGCEMVNCGVGGSRIANYPEGERSDYMCGDARIAEIPTDSDMILVFGGHNDFSITCPMGGFTPWWTLSDEKASGEFIPAYALLVKKLINQFPDARIILVSCVGGRTSNADENQDSNFYLRGYQMQDYSDAIKQISRYFGIPCIDVGSESGINTLNHTTYIADVIHPNDAGGKLIANAVVNGLKRFEPIEF